jgi:hypothetical protein
MLAKLLEWLSVKVRSNMTFEGRKLHKSAQTKRCLLKARRRPAEKTLALQLSTLRKSATFSCQGPSIRTHQIELFEIGAEECSPGRLLLAEARSFYIPKFARRYARKLCVLGCLTVTCN